MTNTRHTHTCCRGPNSSAPAFPHILCTRTAELDTNAECAQTVKGNLLCYHWANVCPKLPFSCVYPPPQGAGSQGAGSTFIQPYPSCHHYPSWNYALAGCEACPDDGGTAAGMTECYGAGTSTAPSLCVSLASLPLSLSLSLSPSPSDPSQLALSLLWDSDALIGYVCRSKIACMYVCMYACMHVFMYTGASRVS